MTASRYVIDSSVWLSYFLSPDVDIAGIIDSPENTLFTSAVSLLEVKRRLIRLKKGGSQIQAALEFMLANSLIVDADCDLCLDAADICVADGLHTVDAMIYACAKKTGSTLATGDRDFEGLADVELIE